MAVDEHVLATQIFIDQISIVQIAHALSYLQANVNSPVNIVLVGSGRVSRIEHVVQSGPIA